MTTDAAGSAFPAPAPDGTVPCTTCGRPRLPNEFGRCSVCGKVIAQSRVRAASPVGAIAWNHGRLIAGLLALAVIVVVGVLLKDVVPYVVPFLADLVDTWPWLKWLPVVLAFAGIFAIERYARTRT